MQKDMRSDQIGGLTRSPELLAARIRYRNGQLTKEELKALEDRDIEAAIAGQLRAGIEVLTDGEMRRDAWQTDLSESVDGFEQDYPVVETKLPDGSVRPLEMHMKRVVGKLHLKRHLLSESLPTLKRHGIGNFKVTMPSPVYAARGGYLPGVTDKAYVSREALAADLIEIFQGEMRWLASEGVRYIQLDEGFAAYVSDGWQSRMSAAALDPQTELRNDIAWENRVWDELPPEVIRGSHICRGNRTRFTGGRGSYDALAERLFNELHVDRFLLEYDTERAGGFEPLRFVPRGKIAVLGVVTTKSGQLESRDELIRKIDAASMYCPIERLAISPQCGFDGFEESHMGVDQQWRKLELIIEVARSVWGTEGE